MHGDPFVILLGAVVGVVILAAIVLETAIGFSRGKKLSRDAYASQDAHRTTSPK